PAPLAPTIACTSPGWQVSVTSCRTVVPKNRLVIPRITSTGSAVAAVVRGVAGSGIGRALGNRVHVKKVSDVLLPARDGRQPSGRGSTGGFDARSGLPPPIVPAGRRGRYPQFSADSTDPTTSGGGPASRRPTSVSRGPASNVRRGFARLTTLAM